MHAHLRRTLDLDPCAMLQDLWLGTGAQFLPEVFTMLSDLICCELPQLMHYSADLQCFNPLATPSYFEA